MGHGPARSIIVFEDGPWPGPAHHIFRGWAAARPGPSIFSEDGLRPGPAHRISNDIRPARPDPSVFKLVGPADIHSQARPMRHGLHMGRPVDLKSRSMGRCEGISGVLVCLTICKRLTNSLPKLSLITSSRCFSKKREETKSYAHKIPGRHQTRKHIPRNPDNYSYE